MLRKLFLILLIINAMPLVSSAKMAEPRMNDTLDIPLDLDSAYAHYIMEEQGNFLKATPFSFSVEIGRVQTN